MLRLTSPVDPAWRVVAALALTQTVGWGVLYYAFTVLVLPMQADLGASRATVSGAFSVAVLASGVAAVPVGRWLDRHRARGLMTAGSAAAVALVLAWSQVRTATQLYVVMALVGAVSAAVLYDAAFAVVVRWFDRDRSRAVLAVTVVAGFASTVFLPTTQALVDAHGWRRALVVLALVLAVTTVLPHALALRREPARTEAAPSRSLRSTARWAVRDRTFQWLVVVFAANTAAVVVVAVHLVPLLRDAGHGARFAAAVTGALGALSVTGRLLVTRAGRRWPATTVTAAAFAVQAVAVVVLLVAGQTAGGAVVFVLGFGLGFGVGTIARPTLIADAYGTHEYATLSGLLAVPLTAAKTAAPFLAGVAVTVTGTYAPVLLALLGTCLLASAAVLAVGRGSAPDVPPLTSLAAAR